MEKRSFLDRVKFVFQGAGKKANPFEKVIMVFGQGTELFSRYNKLSLIKNGYERNPYVKACADKFAQGVASLPIKVTVDSPKGGRTTVEDHPILHLLNRAEDGMIGLIEKYALFWIVTGDSYMQIVTNLHEIDQETGMWDYRGIDKDPGWRHDIKPLELMVWPSQNCNPIQGYPSKPIMGYKFREYGEAEVPEWEIIHWKTPSMDEYWHGLPPLTPLGTIIDLSNNYFLWNLNMVRRGGRPDLVVTSEGAIGEETKNEIKKYWSEKIGGATNKDSEIPVLDGVDLKNMNLGPAEMQWLEGDKHVGRIIAMGMKTPSELINDAQNKTYSNHKEAVKDYHLSSLIPNGQKMWNVINKKLSPFYKDNPRIEIDVEAVDAIQETQMAKTERVLKERKERIISLEESRSELGYGKPSDQLMEEQGDAPRGDSTEEVIEDKLSKLPENIREEVQKLVLNGT